MREIVLLQNLEDLFENLVVHHGLDPDVAALKIASSLVSWPFAVSGGYGVTLGTKSLEVF